MSFQDYRRYDPRKVALWTRVNRECSIIPSMKLPNIEEFISNQLKYVNYYLEGWWKIYTEAGLDFADFEQSVQNGYEHRRSGVNLLLSENTKALREKEKRERHFRNTCDFIDNFLEDKLWYWEDCLAKGKEIEYNGDYSCINTSRHAWAEMVRVIMMSRSITQNNTASSVSVKQTNHPDGNTVSYTGVKQTILPCSNSVKQLLKKLNNAQSDAEKALSDKLEKTLLYKDAKKHALPRVTLQSGMSSYALKLECRIQCIPVCFETSECGS